MDKLITLFVGDLACDIGLAYYYLEVLYVKKLLLKKSNQIYELDDPIEHESIF
jgi:hypothetical protein